MVKSDTIEIWGQLNYIGLDCEGNIHLYLKKKSRINNTVLKKIKELNRTRVKITILKTDLLK